jgi:dephospho-CoA kinase
MKIIGLTGGIGSGKTTVCKIFESLGIPVYYADQEAKKIMTSNRQVKSQVKSLLGEEAYHPNGKPNRKYIGDKVFNDKDLLARISAIVHPAVRLEAGRWAESFKSENGVPYVIQEAALLVENGSYKTMDVLIVVTCPEETRIKRVMMRDRLTYDDVVKKVKSQLPEKEKVRVADYVIINDGKKMLIPQIIDIHKKLMKRNK